MILGFKTKINNKPTYFVEKILRTFLNEYAGKVEGIANFIYDSGQALNYNYVDDIFDKIENQVKPKLHSMREDKKDRWKVGTMIDFFINTRTKDMFRFAPRIPVVSIQEVEIRHNVESCWTVNACEKIPLVLIDGIDRHLSLIRELAQNDGFETIEEFFAYFNEDFTGKIIHWTDKRY